MTLLIKAGTRRRSAVRTTAVVTAALAVGVVSQTVALASSTHPAQDHRHAYSSALTKADVQRLAAHADQRVIVVMRDQHSSVQPGMQHLQARAALTAQTERSVASELRTLNARNVHSFKLISAVSGIVSKAEVARLKNDPAVRAVVPDRPVTFPSSTASTAASTTPQQAAAVGSATAAPPIVRANHVPGTCPKNPSKPLLPEYTKVMHTLAANKIATGRGVKVATFADGIDTSITDFKRPGTNKPVIFDYRDFSGEGTDSQTGGEEAFGDVSSIAAQGRTTFDLSTQVSPKVPLPAHCNIRVLGVSPGASIAVMKWGGENVIPWNSLILQSMDYAVNTDHVNILSESFGGNPLPDNRDADPISMFNTEATRNGVTVVVSSGDSGTTSTIGSPSTARGVISAAGTTTYQIYAQTSSYGAYLGDKHGWESNNIAPISSSGFTNQGQTVDVAAPADGNWADCSPNITQYTECGPIWPGTHWQPVIPFGGTSESAPLTAGVAALVIQAYRNTHHGASPSPALVKRIIKSTATDLQAPAENEGGGLVNALRAVEAARSIKGSGHTPARHGKSLVLSRNEVDRTAAAGSSFTFREKVTNTGARARTVRPQLTSFGAQHRVAKGTLQLKNDGSQPTLLFLGQAGSMAGNNYRVPYNSTTFRVPSGQTRLVTRVAWNGSVGTGMVRASLFDPKGKIVANSRPQGTNGGFGEIESQRPMPGKYRLVVFPTSKPGLFHGPVHYSVATQTDNVVKGAVSPASARVKSGASRTFRVHVSMPASAGDKAVALRTSGAGAVPVIMRALVTPTVRRPGHFTTTITGGNARGGYGVGKWFSFDVPKGVKDVNVDARIAHSGYDLLGFLVDPKGIPQTVGSTLYVNQANASATPHELRTIHLTWATPTPGRWGLILTVSDGQNSALTSTTLSGAVSFNAVHVTENGLPTTPHATIQPGKTRTATIHVSNNGNSPEAYYADPRLNQDQVTVPFDNGTTSGNLPITFADNVSQFFVPPFSSSVTIAAQSHAPSGSTTAPPIDFDSSSAFGTPDLLSNTGTAVTLTFRGNDISSSEYSCTPTIVKPGGYTTDHSSGGTYDCGASVVTKGFNTDITSSTDDLWSDGTITPLVLQPGQTGDIDITISVPASYPQGVSFSGFIAVMTSDPFTVSGDHVISLPYAYTVGSG